jgi:hypothetical protein
VILAQYQPFADFERCVVIHGDIYRLCLDKNG